MTPALPDFRQAQVSWRSVIRGYRSENLASPNQAYEDLIWILEGIAEYGVATRYFYSRTHTGLGISGHHRYDADVPGITLIPTPDGKIRYLGPGVEWIEETNESPSSSRFSRENVLKIVLENLPRLDIK
jgi:hypothetical protein